MNVARRFRGSVGRKNLGARLARRAFMVASVVVMIAPALSNTYANASCSGKALRPSDNIAAIINNAGTGASFCFAPGTYHPSATIRPKDNDHFLGTGTSRDAVLITTSKLQVIFNAGSSSGVTYTNLAVSGAVNACPLRNCGATGDGIHGGTNVKVTNVHVYSNGRTGIASINGLTITGSRLDHNGAVHGAMDGVSAGVKSATSLTVTGSSVDHNYGNGIWCDNGCGAFTVTGDRVAYNVSTGIHYEISQGPALISNNVVQNNNMANEVGHGGIGIIDSKNASVLGNTLGGNKGSGIRAKKDKRGFVLTNVSIHTNKMSGDGLFGCGSGVTCYANS
ncbi:MAG: right-handed parallel beta-helix repeat-containing protein [Actinomycetota bacterium]|nr:right-handed parallel beta-helix repeat-containing protein [Actinomycetota bacterium]